MLIIGDVHGKLAQYDRVLSMYKGNTVQLGDFGFQKEHDYFLENIDTDKHKILFGNHDYYPYLDRKHSLGNYKVIEDVFFIRGANSIDKHLRTEGLDWFSNEELNYREFGEAIDEYERVKPRIVVSHDCPHVVREHLFGITDKSTTSNGLQAMLELHQPDLWVFGHHHKSRSEKIEGTVFKCLAELECLLI